MKNLKKNICAGLIIASVSTFAISAHAQPGKGNPHKNKGNFEKFVDHHEHDDDKVTIRIDFDDRNIIQDYLRSEYRGKEHCPPGLAKKNPPCVPPGQAKKWSMGNRLADGSYYPINNDLRRLLGPVPAGYDYVRVDQDILLIGEATKKVIDAVTLISAVD